MNRDGKDMRFGRKILGKDYETAIKWATQATEQGHAVGQYNLGLLYSIEHVLTYSGFVIRAPYILRNSPIKIINTLFAEYMRNRFVQLKVRKEGIQ